MTITITIERELLVRMEKELFLARNYGGILRDELLLKEVSAALAAPATAPDAKAMAERLMGWPLPKDFSPDCGISFDGRKNDEWNKNKTWPTGTNLLTVDQAIAMFKYVLSQE